MNFDTSTAVLTVAVLGALYYFVKVKGVKIPLPTLPSVPTVTPGIGDDTDSPIIALLKGLAAREFTANPVMLNIIQRELEALDQLLKDQQAPAVPEPGAKP